MAAMIFQQVWYHICFLLGLSGNLFVLHGSIVHKAIRLDNMSLWIIKNLAVTDILNCVCVLLPTLISQYAGNRWIFGNTVCKIVAIFRWTFSCANMFLINVLSINKLYRCIYPLKNLVRSKKRKIVVTVLTIVFSLIPSLGMYMRLVHGSTEVYFHSSRSNCELDPYESITRNWGKILNYLALAFVAALPNLLLIVTNVLLIGYAAMKTKTTINKRNILIVILVTASYAMSYIPSLIVLSMRNQGLTRDLAWHIVFLQTWINPFIYVAVNPSFKAYTKDRLIFWRRKRNQVSVMSTSLSRGQKHQQGSKN